MSKQATFLFLGCFSFTAADNTRGTFNILASAKDPKGAMEAFETELNRQFDVQGGLLHQLKDIAVYCPSCTLLGERELPDSIMINFSAYQLAADQILDAAFIPQMGTFALSVWMPTAPTPDGKGTTNLFWLSNPESASMVAEVLSLDGEALVTPKASVEASAAKAPGSAEAPAATEKSEG